MAEEVRQALRRRFLTMAADDDPVEVAMGLLRPVLEAQQAEIARLRKRASGW